jgi:L,D-transpeptidase YcbB
MIPRIAHPFTLLAMLVALLIAAIDAPARAGGFDQALTIWTQALENRLVTLEEVARTQGVPTSTRIARGLVLKPGMVDERVLQLGLRLIELGYLPPGSERDIHDDIVVAAASVFQAERGLNPDGKVGGATLASLNVTPAEEIASIRETLTRMAEFRALAPTTLVVVNLPAQELALVRDGETVLTMETAVG